MRFRYNLYIIFLIIYPSFIFGNSDIKVLVSIKPFHSLVSAVMEGVSEPKLILEGGESPHSYSLPPSSAEYMQDADIIFWGGRYLETFLAKSIDIYSKKKKIVSFIDLDEIMLLKVPNYSKVRKIELFSRSEKPNKNIESYFGLDPHIWLDPKNAKIILREISMILGKIDPRNAITYRKNREKYEITIDELDNELSKKMISVSSIPFLVFHNAFQYFEHRYGLKIIGSFTFNSSFGMSARRMKEIQKIISEKNISCIFMEQNMSKKLMNIAVEGTETRIGILDPLGVKINKGPDLYAKLLKNLSNSLIKCLKG